jgi:integrase/recombinase XerC
MFNLASGRISAYCEIRGVASIAQVQPPQMAAIHHLFDWQVTGQVVHLNPAASSRGQRDKVRH